MEGTTSKGQSNIETEKNLIEKIETEVKNFIYGIIFVVLKENHGSVLLSFFLTIIHFVQLHYFCFSDQVKSLLRSSLL